MKKIGYSGAGEYEWKRGVQAAQGRITDTEKSEKGRTGAEPRYRMVEDEDSIYEYDLKCLEESEKKSVTGKRSE